MIHYSVSQISEILGVNTETVRRLVRSKQLISSPKSTSRKILVTEQELDKFIRDNSVPKDSFNLDTLCHVHNLFGALSFSKKYGIDRNIVTRYIREGDIKAIKVCNMYKIPDFEASRVITEGCFANYMISGEPGSNK